MVKSMKALDPAATGRIALLAALGVLLIGLPVPIPIRALIEVGFMAAAVVVTVLGLARQPHFRVARIAYLLMLALYVALLLHTNLPSVKVGMEGIRYAMVALSGLVLGLSLPDLRPQGQRSPTVRLIPGIAALMLAAAAASLVVHLFFPGAESSFDRAAETSTASLGGQPRMQGLLSGPFHVAMLGCFLTLGGAWQLLRRQPLGLVVLLIGETVLLLARVRSGLIATALGLIALFALAWFQRERDPRLAGLSKSRLLTGFAILPVLMVLIGAVSGNIDRSVNDADGNGQETTSNGGGANSAITELQGISGDHRTKDRAKAIELAAELSLDSPLTGWGPGASASGLRTDFTDNGKTQVNPHSGVLVLTVDAGIGALAAFLAIIGSVGLGVWRELRRLRQPAAAGFALAAIAPLAVLWLLGDALAALPISLCLMLIIGVYAAGRAVPIEDGMADHGT